jgi:hypothetical protein
MANIRKTHGTQAKVKIYGVHATQINNWKKAALDIIPEAFSSKRKRVEDDQQALAEVKSHILRMWF